MFDGLTRDQEEDLIDATATRVAASFGLSKYELARVIELGSKYIDKELRKSPHFAMVVNHRVFKFTRKYLEQIIINES